MHPRNATLLGKYRTPRFKYGDEVFCELRGFVRIVSLSNGRIPWPKAHVGRAHAIILYGDLADAVRRESTRAVCYWFGVGRDTVWRWRTALGVELTNEGTRASYVRHAPFTVQSAKANRRRKAAYKRPERGAKIAAALTGRKRPPEVMAPMHQARKLRGKVSKATRKKMSESHKRRHREMNNGSSM